MGLRTPNEPISDGERAFMLASTKKALKESDVPVTVRNFSKPKKDAGGKS